MVLVLCIGDLHVPCRAVDLPSKFRSLLVPGKIHKVLCTGNLCTGEMHDFLRSICSDITVSQGNLDDNQKYNDTQLVNIGNFKVAVCHGHQIVPWGNKEALTLAQRRVSADILVTGHVRSFKTHKHADGFILNPGSATGVLADAPSTPSFILMDIDGTRATVYLYELVEGEVKVEKMSFEK